MEVRFEYVISDNDVGELSKILGCHKDALEQTIADYAKASLQEYISMFLGQKVYTRGSDINEYRLFLLIESALGGKIPDESLVSRMFQTTATESRSLIRHVMSKFQSQLKRAVEKSLMEILQGAEIQESDDSRIVTINSQNLVEEMNRTLAETDGSLPPVTKKRGSVATYEIPASSYTRLSERFGVPHSDME